MEMEDGPRTGGPFSEMGWTSEERVGATISARSSFYRPSGRRVRDQSASVWLLLPSC